MANYEIPFIHFKKFLDSEISGFVPQKVLLAGIPRTRKLILEYIYNYWNKDFDSGEELNDLEKSVQNMEDAADSYMEDQAIYIPHPLDGLFVIDSSSPQRKLDLLESRIEKTLQKSLIQTGNQQEMPSKPLESFARAVCSTPKAKPAVKVAGKRCAVYVAAQKGTTQKQLEDKCKDKLKKYDLKVEKLVAETVTSNFRVTCESWPVNADMSKCEQWHRFDVKVRPWHGPIQSLDLKPKIRRLISRIDSNSTSDEIKNKIESIYENNADLSVRLTEFVHKVQNDNYKNYVVEISSISHNNVIDKLTPYCQQNTITIRPWKGKPPINSFPKFI